MKYLHVINIEKHNPGYKDRESKWLKYHFNAMNDQPWTRLHETDQMRFLTFIRLEIQTKSPVLLDPDYLRSQGFKFRNRDLQVTVGELVQSDLVMLQDSATLDPSMNADSVSTESVKSAIDNKPLRLKSVTQRRREKSRKDKIIYVKDRPPTKEEILKHISKHDYIVDGSYFYDKYTAEGWLKPNGKPMLSWKGTLVTWHHNRQSETKELPHNHPDSKFASH
jgi:hypothetical protein